MCLADGLAIAADCACQGFTFSRLLTGRGDIFLAAVGIGYLIGNRIVTESGVGCPGLGRLRINGFPHRDRVLIQAGRRVGAAGLSFSNRAVDLLYGLLNLHLRVAN